MLLLTGSYGIIIYKYKEDLACGNRCAPSPEEGNIPMKKYLILLLIILAAALVACAVKPAGSGSDTDGQIEPITEPVTPAPVLIKEIPDQSKGYFGETDSSRTFDLTEYIDPNGAELSYTAVSSDETAVTVSVEGSLLTATVLSGEADAEITVTAAAGGTDPLTFSFRMKGITFKKIVCVGDSHTYGHTWTKEAYPVFLNKLFKDIRIAGFGSNGASIAGMVPDEEGYMDREPYPKSLAYNPDIVIAFFGANDARAWEETKDVFVDRYLAFLDTYKEVNPDVKFIIITPPPCMWEGMNDGICNGVCPLLRTMCEENDIPLVDFNAYMLSLEDSGFSMLRPEDGLHLNPEAAQFLAGMVAEEIKKQ